MRYKTKHLPKLPTSKKAYLSDAKKGPPPYEEMQSRIKLLEGIALGEKAILEKRILSHKEAKQRMARWLA